MVHFIFTPLSRYVTLDYPDITVSAQGYKQVYCHNFFYYFMSPQVRDKILPLVLRINSRLFYRYAARGTTN
jgi:hypothetical protein